MVRLPATQLRDDMTDLLNRVAYGHERIILRRYGKDLVALVPLEDLEVLEALGRTDGAEPAAGVSDLNGGEPHP